MVAEGVRRLQWAAGLLVVGVTEGMGAAQGRMMLGRIEVEVAAGVGGIAQAGGHAGRTGLGAVVVAVVEIQGAVGLLVGILRKVVMVTVVVVVAEGAVSTMNSGSHIRQEDRSYPVLSSLCTWLLQAPAGGQLFFMTCMHLKEV